MGIYRFSGIPACATIIGYKIYDDNNGLTENTDLTILYNSADYMVIRKLTDYNRVTTLIFYIEVEEAFPTFYIYQTPIIWEL